MYYKGPSLQKTNTQNQSFVINPDVMNFITKNYEL